MIQSNQNLVREDPLSMGGKKGVFLTESAFFEAFLLFILYFEQNIIVNLFRKALIYHKLQLAARRLSFNCLIHSEITR